MIMAKLKEATRKQHEGVEGTVNMMDEMSTLDRYKLLLCRFYRYYRSAESVISGIDLSETGFRFEERLKTPAIERDLEFLGVLDQAKDLPEWKLLPEMKTAANVFGVLYVLEGATLGGQVISRHLNQTLSLTPENGAAFFSGYGAQTGPMWKEFGAITADFAERANDDDSIIKSAIETFETINKCLSDPIRIN